MDGIGHLLLLLSLTSLLVKSYSSSKHDQEQDLISPGVAIISSWAKMPPNSDFSGEKRKLMFNITSCSSKTYQYVCAAAYIKALYPEWPHDAIRSALMTKEDIDCQTITFSRCKDSQQLTPIPSAAEEEIYNPIPYLSAIADSVAESMKNKNPGKRTVTDSSPDEAKLSSNKVLRNFKLEHVDKQCLDL